MGKTLWWNIINWLIVQGGSYWKTQLIKVLQTNINILRLLIRPLKNWR